MAGVRLSPEAESELDQIWLYLADASGSTEVASRVIERITEQFWYLARHPHIGRRRDADLRPGLRSLAADEYVVIYRMDTDGGVLVLHILHGRRDIATFFAG